VDYKTDAVTAEQVLAATEAHRRQLELYRRAVAAIWGRPVVRTTVAFLSVPACIDVR
jgi:ATP-dependent exoDNAse (exonuclease V) beta subunit